MGKEIKNTAKHSIIYAIGNMGSKLVGFLLIPLYTNPDFFSVSDYGALAILEASLQVLVGILTFSMTNSLSRWYWDEQYVDKQKSIFFTAVVFLITILVPVVLALFTFSKDLSELIFKTANYSTLIKITVATAAVQVINNITLTLLKLKSQSSYFVGLQIFKFATLLIVVIWALRIKNAGLTGVWSAYLIAEVLVFILLLPTLIKNLQFKLQISVLKEMLSYGLPLMLASLSSVLLSVTDRYMLNSMQGLEKTAVYSIGYRIANTLRIVVTASIAVALLPLRMKKINEKNNGPFYAKVMKYSSLIFSFALIVLTLFSLEILKIITGSDFYWQAHEIVAIVSFALLFGHIKDDAITGLTIRKRTKIIGILIFVTSLINIALNALLIPIWNEYGAAFATLASQFLFLCFVYIAAQKAYNIPYEVRNMLISTLLVAIIVVAGLSTTEFNIGIRISIKLCLLFAYPLLLWLFNYFDKGEKENIKQVIRTWRNPSKLKENLNRFLR